MGGDQQPALGPRSSLAELLLTNELELAKLLILKGGLFDSNSISEHILTLSVLYGKATKLITWAAFDEIETTKSEGTLFRGTSHATRLMSHFFMQPVGQEYLKQIVLPLLSNMTSCGGSFEIDPDRLDSSQSAEENLARLLLVVQTFLDTIMESRKKFPPLFSEVLSLIQQKTKEKFSTAEHNVIGGFVFLRFLCPAMVTPEKYSIINVSPTKEVRRGLVLVSKILQNLANGVEFGMKEGYMVKLNSFVEKNMQMMTDYFDDITNAIDRSDPQKTRSDTVGVPSQNKLSSSPTLQKSMSMFLSRVRSSTQSGAGAAINAKAAETLLAIDIYLQTNRATIMQGLPEHLQEQLCQVLDGLIKKEVPEKKKSVEPQEKKKPDSEKKRTIEEPIRATAKLTQLDPPRRRSASFKGTPSFVQSLRNIGEPKRARQQQQQDDLTKYEIEHLKERLAAESKNNEELKRIVADTTKERDFFKQVFDAAVLEGDQIKLTLEQTMIKVNKRRDTTIIKAEAKQELQSLYEAELTTRKAMEAENQGLREKIRSLNDSTGSLTIENTVVISPENSTLPPISAPPAEVSPVKDEIIDKLHQQLVAAEKEIQNLKRQLAERDSQLLSFNSSGSDCFTLSSDVNFGSDNTPTLTVSVDEGVIALTPSMPTTHDNQPETPKLTRQMKSKSSNVLSMSTKPLLGIALESRPRLQTNMNLPVTDSTQFKDLSDSTAPTIKPSEGLKKSVSIDGLESLVLSQEEHMELEGAENGEDTMHKKLENWQKEYSIKDKLKFFEMKVTEQTPANATKSTTKTQPT